MYVATCIKETRGVLGVRSRRNAAVEAESETARNRGRGAELWERDMGSIGALRNLSACAMPSTSSSKVMLFRLGPIQVLLCFYFPAVLIPVDYPRIL
jgi:hypothetical protein